jgi:hypothetical protein
MATLTNVVTRVQSLLGDVSGDYWTITTLTPHINAGLRKVSRKYRAHSIRFGRARATLTPLAIGVTSMTRATTLALPSDFLEPFEICEKAVGAADTEYVLLDQAADQLPDIPQSETLGVWDWFSNTIWFIGATTARTLRIDYQRGITDLSAGADVLVVDDSLDAVSYFGAAEAAHSVGQSQLAANLEAQGNDSLADLITTEVKVMQRTPRRRMAPNVTP